MFVVLVCAGAVAAGGNGAGEELADLGAEDEVLRLAGDRRVTVHVGVSS